MQPVFDFNLLLERLAGSRSRLITYGIGGRTVRTFSQVLPDVRLAMEFLRRRGIRQGARVGIHGGNCFEWVVLDLACLGLGAVTVAFDASRPYTAASREAFALSLVLTQEEPATPDPEGRRFSFAEALGPAASVDHAASFHRYAPGAVVAVKFTSGTTGESKAMEVGRESVEDSIASVQSMFRHGPGDRVLVFLPLHLIQQRYWIYSAITFGFDIILCRYEHAMGLLRQEKPTVIMGVPGFFENLLKAFRLRLDRDRQLRAIRRRGKAIPLPLLPAANRNAGAAFRDFLGGSIRYLWTGSAGMSQAVMREYESLGVQLYQGYGTNETCIVSKNHPGKNRLGSVGPILPNREVRFDESGQILVRPKHPVARSYIGGETAESLRIFRPDGFIATGDIGYLDTDGYLHISGRLKDVIVLSSGRKVNPNRVEGLLKACPHVGNCMVYGSEKPYLVSVIVPAGDHRDRRDLLREIEAANRKLAPDERVYAFLLSEEEFTVENGFLNAQLKLKRAAIVERYGRALEALYEENA